MAQSFSNNFTTTLNGAITSGATALSVQTAAGSPASGQFTIGVYVLNTNGTFSNFELMLVTAGQGTVNWTVTRGQEGTAAVSHANGEQVSQIWTLAGLNSLGNQFWPYLSPSGITGAIAATRYVGGTASGAPSSGGPFAAGDFDVDQSGGIWVCTVAGSPGTWVPAARNTYRARMYLNVAQSLPSGTWTNIPFDTIEFDDSPGASMAVTGASAHMVAPLAGLYLIDVQYIIPSATGNTRVVCDLAEAVFSSGYVPGANTWRASDDAKVGVANANYTAGRTMMLKLPANTPIYAGAFQTSASVNFGSGTQPQQTWLGMSLLSVS